MTYVGRVMKLALILLVVYFSQVYPYVHFHHSHDDSDNSIEFSLHTTDISHQHPHDGDDHASKPHDEESNHHHHSEFDQHIDLHLARSHVSSVLTTLDITYISVRLDSVPILDESAGFAHIESTRLPESIPIDGITSRGPPLFG